MGSKSCQEGAEDEDEKSSQDVHLTYLLFPPPFSFNTIR